MERLTIRRRMGSMGRRSLRCPGRGHDSHHRFSRRVFLRRAGLAGIGLAGAVACAGCGRLPLPTELLGQRWGVEKRQGLEYREFGDTGEKVAMLGLGGYHFIEISQGEVTEIVQRYLDMGGNYVETAYAYGSGDSERKIGKALKGRRDEAFLVTKVAARDSDGAARLLKRSLENLQTDYVDLLFMHAVQETYELEAILSEKGALRTAEETQQAGEVRFVGVSGHGWADVLIEALERYPFDAVMHTFNYLDRFNYPSSETALLPLAAENGVAVVGMKPVGDGYLYRSPEPAFRYAFALPCATMVAGMNTLEYLETDMAAAKAFKPMDKKEMEELYAEAPELGDYVCRQCYRCVPNPSDVPIPQIFQLEGMYDRQMDDGRQHEPQDQLLRSRLKGWFGMEHVAWQRYRELGVNTEDFESCAEVEPHCPYGIEIVRKLKLANAKLG
jgi:predicted aldo/keto reductase-like oxidoreductase